MRFGVELKKEVEREREREREREEVGEYRHAEGAVNEFR
jgi:hypothetical protein